MDELSTQKSNKQHAQWIHLDNFLKDQNKYNFKQVSLLFVLLIRLILGSFKN